MRQHFTIRIEVCTIDLTLNLLLPHVVLTHVTTSSFESTNSSTMKLLHTNSLICDFEISTKRFRSSTLVDLMQQLYTITEFCYLHKVSSYNFKRVWKTLDLYTKHCPLGFVKTCSRVSIYIYLRSIETLDPIAKKEIG